MIYLKSVTKQPLLYRHPNYDGETYQDFVAVARNNIVLMAIPEEYVQRALSVRCGCCGNERPCFVRATQAEVEQWNAQESE